ncbi:nitronate monooxygenase family protein [Ruegeria sp. PrR005]|uniref:Nitronate monooxygenase n=1 Tax=Ruegeria sp. PrR005 TaxID=2706882 RepID=A0A6B2NQY5_9RHOB|nr:nitronate monooxygenase [Ruegeria sp. PrR005]NDW45223.1 nitronate monooxygenase [Ruegeria sp. PrR005]
MWPDQRLCDLLGIEHPIIQAPMTGTCTPALAAAVCNAGGLGSLGCAEKPLDRIRREVAELRALTGRPFNLNFFTVDAPRTDPQTLARTRDRLKPWYDRYNLGTPPVQLPDLKPGFDAEKLDLMLELRPRMVSFHFGIPEAAVLTALKGAGIILVGTATTAAEARALDRAGFDAIIAQGWEAGGHRGSHRVTRSYEGVGTMALVPQVADAVSVPVIAAGGIADGRGIAAALALGASGVQMGTAFLRCPEAATATAWRDRLRTATEADTMATDAFSGRCARALRSRHAEEMAQHHDPLPGFIQMYALSGPLLDAAPDEEVSFHLCGQALTLGRDITAADLIARLIAETRNSLARLAPR